MKSVYEDTDISSIGPSHKHWDEIPEESDENSSMDETTPRRLEEAKEEEARLQEELISGTKAQQKVSELLLKVRQWTPGSNSVYNTTLCSSKKESLMLSQISSLNNSWEDNNLFASPNVSLFTNKIGKDINTGRKPQF